MSAFTVDHVKICLTPSLITVQNLVAVSHTVRAPVGGLKNLATLGPISWNGSVARTRNTLLSHVCCHTGFRRSTLNRLGVGRGPKKFGSLGLRPLGMGAWLTSRNTPLPTCVTIPNFVAVGQTVCTYIVVPKF